MTKSKNVARGDESENSGNNLELMFERDEFFRANAEFCEFSRMEF